MLAVAIGRLIGVVVALSLILTSSVAFDDEGKPAIIAAEVKKRDSVLKLRDENGIPVWADGTGKSKFKIH